MSKRRAEIGQIVAMTTAAAAATLAATTPATLLRTPYRLQKQSNTGIFVAAAIVGIILAIATDAVHAKSPDETKLSQIRTTCRQQSSPQPSDAEYKLITEHKLLNAETTAATTPKSLQCFCLCYLKAAGVFTNNAPSTQFLGETLPTLVKATPLKTSELIGKCGKPTGADDCEKAFNFVNCMAKEAKIYLY